jgi:Co/Zn/Cd efflux system component
MSKQNLSDQRHRLNIERVRVATFLLDGPKTFEAIVDSYNNYLRYLGLFKTTEKKVNRQMVFIRKRLEELVELGWIVYDERLYSLTTQGRDAVDKRLFHLGETGASIRNLLQPKAVSKVTLVVHWVLVAIKLPAGLLSRSAGLINDSLDTLLDGLSSLLVYFGIRFKKERIANILLVIMMMATGLLTLFEAGRRLFVHYEPKVDWFAFLAVILSAAICLVLYFYQRYVGLRSGIMALITQSVDSRNHVIVAISVTAGLIASKLSFPFLDTMVGLVVAFLILKSAVCLTLETVRSFREEEIDLSRYEFGIVAQYEKFRQAQLRDWMLYLVYKQKVCTRNDLVEKTKQALDFNRVPAARAIGLTQDQSKTIMFIENGFMELFRNGWLSGEDKLSVTEAGRKHLGKWKWRKLVRQIDNPRDERSNHKQDNADTL